ncbi:lytic transglycosylase domain-containing protein [Salmonella bongori]|uniref:lytic transglycosylase domain-containing protein n=1 Tax=Salmonella bongori TaxID=54736 RepID=UPI00215D86A5|nr:lytic transglycosylase domain-containing protein [Salmonella bongori]
MIINELAYKVTIKADEFLNGKRKLKDEVKQLEGDFDRSGKNISRTLKSSTLDVTQFGSAAASSFRGAYTAAAGFLGIGAGLYGIKQLFTSTSNEIVRASNQAKFFGTDVNKMFGMRRGFQQAGLNGDAFIGASGNARMALANIKDPTIFGGLTGAAQNLMVLGARTGLNINNLGDPNKALGEFTRYGKSHSQENLMQVMAAAGFDPTDAAKIKSGELKSLVDSETKKSNITAAQVKEQENLLVKMGELSSQVERVAQGIAMAFTPAVMEAMDSFGKWIEAHQGDIVGFFREAGDKIKSFTDAVGGAENALKILAGLYIGKNALGLAVAGAGAGSGGKGFGALLGRLGLLGAGVYYSGDIADATTPNSVLGMRDEDKPFLYQKHWMERLLGLDYQEDIPPSARNPSGRTLADKNNNPGNIRGRNGLGGFSGYATEQEGWDAMSNQLMRYFNGQTTGKKLRTVSDIISTWAPPSENDTASYIKQVAGFVGVGENQELNLADPNVMAKLRTAMAKHEGFGNWKNGLSIGGANQFQNEYYLQQQKLANSRPPTNASNVDNSRTSSTNINTVVVNSNPQSADALTKSINQQVSRASTNAAFSSGVTP